MSSDIDEMLCIYKMGKSIRGIGTSLLWSNIYSSLLIVGFFIISMYIPIFIYLILIPLSAIIAFQILNVVYKIKMTIQGFNLASAIRVKEFKIFSLFYILSYIIIMTMYGIITYLILFKGLNIISVFSNPTYNQFNSLYQYVVQLGFIQYIPIIILFGGYGLRIISWFYFRDGIRKTIYYDIVEVISSKSIQMAAWLLILAILNFILFILFRFTNIVTITIYGIIWYPSFELIVLISLLVPLIYAFEISVYRSIGRMMKTVYGEPTLSKSSYQYSQQSEHNNPNPDNNSGQISKSSSQKGKNSAIKSNDGFIYCPECGSPNSINDVDCQTCGKPLKK